jgi:hypothetical protein
VPAAPAVREARCHGPPGRARGAGWLATGSHGRAGRQGAPQGGVQSTGSAEACIGDAALGSSNILAGREPASPALGSVRPQRCPDPLPASVLVHAAWARNRTRAQGGRHGPQHRRHHRPAGRRPGAPLHRQRHRRHHAADRRRPHEAAGRAARRRRLRGCGRLGRAGQARRPVPGQGPPGGHQGPPAAAHLDHPRGRQPLAPPGRGRPGPVPGLQGPHRRRYQPGARRARARDGTRAGSRRGPSPAPAEPAPEAPADAPAENATPVASAEAPAPPAADGLRRTPRRKKAASK